MTSIAVWRRALVAGAVTIGMGAGAAPAAAEEPASVGWWWAGRPSATVPALFSPVPTPPEGGLYVAGGPSGPLGISALRFEVGPDTRAATLTLTIADVQGTPAISACAATGPWEPADNGGWDQRAEPDCEAASVTGTVDADETEVSFALFAFQDDTRVIDVVLVPSTDPETDRPASFSVAFEAPGDDALAVTEPDANTDNATDTDTSTDTESPDPAIDAAPTPRPPAAAGPITRRGQSNQPQLAPPDRASTPGQSEPPVEDFAAPTPLAGGIDAVEGFAYPAVLALPLLLLTAGSYLGWALTRPVVVRGASVR